MKLSGLASRAETGVDVVVMAACAPLVFQRIEDRVDEILETRADVALLLVTDVFQLLEREQGRADFGVSLCFTS